MNETERKSHLDMVMGLLGVDARQAGRACGVSNSLISRWQQGTRTLTTRSRGLMQLAEFLLEQDRENLMKGLLAPYRTAGEDEVAALCSYLTDELPASLHPRTEPPELQTEGEFSVVQHVLLGKKGFEKAALMVLDYLRGLPPGREILVYAHTGLSLWHLNPGFAVQAIYKMRQAQARDTRFTLIVRRSDEVVGSPYFSVFWLVLQMRKNLRCRFYEGDSPSELFALMIPGYLSAFVETDEDAVDGIVTTLGTDARSIRSGERRCGRYQERSTPAARFGFFDWPEGLVRELEACSAQGSSHASASTAPMLPDGPEAVPFAGMTVFSRVPSFGLMTKEEAEALLGRELADALPDFLLGDDTRFTQMDHRVILCREDIREGLGGKERRNEVLSALAGRDIYVPRDMLYAQMKRIQHALRGVEGFELAIVPRVAFDKLEMEMVHQHGRYGLCWLQDVSESMYGCDPTVVVSFDMAAEFAWKRLRGGWKRHRSVTAYLRKWLIGQELDTPLEDSATVRNWDVLPKE